MFYNPIHIPLLCSHEDGVNNVFEEPLFSRSNNAFTNINSKDIV